jgi:hypothetical protein
MAIKIIFVFCALLFIGFSFEISETFLQSYPAFDLTFLENIQYCEVYLDTIINSDTKFSSLVNFRSDQQYTKVGHSNIDGSCGSRLVIQPLDNILTQALNTSLKCTEKNTFIKDPEVTHFYDATRYLSFLIKKTKLL